MTREQHAMADWCRKQIDIGRDRLETADDPAERGAIRAYRAMLAQIEKPDQAPDKMIGTPEPVGDRGAGY